VENGKTQVVTYVGTHTFNLTPIKIINMVNDFRLIKPNGKIILVGHSLGAYNIVQALEKLNDINVSVDLVILLDTSNKKYNNYDFLVRKNVKNIYNYTSPKWSDKLKFFTNSGGLVIPYKGNSYTNYRNIEIEGVEHTTIDNEIPTLVINDIRKFLYGKPN
jgi:pimeloyl-ACP methyl ester carboxylesterase